MFRQTLRAAESAVLYAALVGTRTMLELLARMATRRLRV
jgi:hypothetical protein